MATNASSTQLVEGFKNSKIFWQQFEIAKQIAARSDTNVLTELASGLTNEDRHASGNTAFIFAGMGDNRGFEVLRKILGDRSERPEGQGVPGGNWTLQAQIASDRYYAVHLFGDLKDPRVVPILVPLLRDKEVNYIVPWALGEIGDKRAVEPLIGALSDQDASLRVLAIYSLEKLKANEALPRLQALLNDNDRSNFGDRVSVAEAVKAAITNLETKP
jgi:HEAT repeat protein